MKKIRLTLTSLLLTLSSTFIHADTAVFAGGCFWCTESDFEKLEGVRSAVSGYTGGHTKNPTYKEVTYKNTGHYEAVKVDYDPEKISFQELLDHYWTTIDPFDPRGQFCDKGHSYKSAIFVANKDERERAELSKAKHQKSFGDSLPITTVILDSSTFYDAEDYHQDYYKKNPLRYKYYRWNCGRDQRLQAIWGSAAKAAEQP